MNSPQRSASYRFKASETFWRKFYHLPPREKEAVRQAWQFFRVDPFDTRLGTHKINALSGVAKRTIYSVVIAADLRVLFYIEGDVIFTFDMGSHVIYR